MILVLNQSPISAIFPMVWFTWDKKRGTPLEVVRILIFKTTWFQFSICIFRIKPSPMKVETTTPDGKKTARIKIRFRHGQLQSPKVQIKNPSQLRNTSAICEQNKEISSNNRSATSKNGSLRKEVNESLSNLQQDISSIIEQSFGSVQVILT